MKNTPMLWRWLAFIFVLSFGALGYLGLQIYLTAPPIPKSVVSTTGEVLFTGEQVQKGQQVWLASGGQQQGTVWGHGAYLAPDWSADWLHREATALQALRTQELRKPESTLSAADRGAVAAALKEEMRRNTYGVSQGLWYARSPEIVHSGVMETLVWMRVPGDIVFAVGALFLAWYAARLLRRPVHEHAGRIMAPAAP